MDETCVSKARLNLLDSMSESINLVTAQVSFLESNLAVVHIPRELYPLALLPVLQLLFGEDDEGAPSDKQWTDRHDFLNFSITPLECSIVCSRALADSLVAPIANQLNTLTRMVGVQNQLVEVNQNDYIGIRVEGEGLDAGQRVLELTAPLAMAGISIFFITTYFCDYILVPTTAKHKVTLALQQRGFIFSEEADAFISQLSPTLAHGHFGESSPSGSSNSTDSRPASAVAPPTPPAKDIPELQTRTFSKLRTHKIEPRVDDTLRLVSCAGSRDNNEGDLDRLKNDLLQVLLSMETHETGSSASRHSYMGKTGLGIRTSAKSDHLARFLSITLTAEPVSILLEESLLPRFGSALLGNKMEEDVLIPIMLDLSSLGWTATGIVGGVAGRLSQGPISIESRLEALDGGVQEEELQKSTGPIEISFLSTAKAGTVIVKASELGRAIKAMEMGMREIEGYHKG